jgi:hypothetical protein
VVTNHTEVCEIFTAQTLKVHPLLRSCLTPDSADALPGQVAPEAHTQHDREEESEQSKKGYVIRSEAVTLKQDLGYLNG